ncbi:DUF1707 domain-containing protein [Umezawaea sp. Da 62-37]|uniref:DUF1707 SHOCT-like domain-containing protein n=1 Tax=Umezawaea sp. Da 62-37 TaxID=3075927 RepID=UPI0028F736D1|nr:DUF1707 domain-containing protein [Umezawaea sp. Da 62-37]WNV90871.1 DUF1707 domain-containing protein [Umezawaea sp. Da 62-37]
MGLLLSVWLLLLSAWWLYGVVVAFVRSSVRLGGTGGSPMFWGLQVGQAWWVTEDTPTMRAADNDREAVVEQLARAQAEGRLNIAEFDERVRLVWLAQTYAELAALTADLPPDRPIVPVLTRQSMPVYEHQAYRPDAYAHATQQVELREPGKFAVFFFRAWVAASMINFVIWGLVVVTNLEWVHPWWIWVAGPWGALVLANRVTRFGLPR